jgi:thiamine-phosphate pyrophosphorylase
VTGFFDKPLIYLITGGEATAENFSRKSAEILKLVETAVETKINLIQIREKALPARLVFELAAKASKIVKNSSTKLLVNDRADIALASQAEGVHLTSVSIPSKVIRQNFPPDFIIGVSAHSIAEAETAKDGGANFVTFSPVFPTPSKEKYGVPQGLEKLREVCERLRNFPVIALGGIDESNFSLALETGASGFAAIRFLNNADNLRRLTLKLRKS